MLDFIALVIIAAGTYYLIKKSSRHIMDLLEYDDEEVSETEEKQS